MHSALICAEVTFGELTKKQVVNVCDGKILGCICDLGLDLCDGRIKSVILPGSGVFASLSAKNRIVIPCCDIERIGDDVILVKYVAPPEEKK